MAVKIFFFLSGLVVTNSLLHKRNVLHFVIARFFRIWPALACVVLVCALLLGPWVSTLPASEYFAQAATYHYIRDNLLLSTQYALPGVFQENPLKESINGSLWTLAHEVGAYLALLALFIVGVLRRPWLAVVVGCVLALDPLLGNRLLFTWRPPLSEVDLLAPCFAAGALLALFKERIEVNIGTVLGWGVLYWLLRPSAHSFYFFTLPCSSASCTCQGSPPCAGSSRRPICRTGCTFGGSRYNKRCNGCGRDRALSSTSWWRWH